MRKILILLLLTVSTSLLAQDNTDNEAQQLLEKVRKNLNAMSANFEQFETDANQNNSGKSSGKMWLNAPNQFKWKYKKPTPQLIVANGEKVWIYDEDLDQVTIKPQQSAANPIYVLLDKERTESNYNLKVVLAQKDEDKKYQWINMTPKIAADEIKMIWLGIDKRNNISVLKLMNKMDNVVTFNFSKIHKNPHLTKDFFNFVIPENTDVLSESAGFAESDF